MHIPSLPRPDARWFTGLGVGLVIGVLAVGAVSAASPAASAPPITGGSSAGATAGAATNPVAGRAGLRLRALRHLLGRNFRVAVDATSADGTRHVLAVRGTLDVSTASVSVTLPDASTQTFAVDATTVVREHGKTTAFSTLTDGQKAVVIGLRNDDGSFTARLIRIVKPPKPAAP